MQKIVHPENHRVHFYGKTTVYDTAITTQLIDKAMRRYFTDENTLEEGIINVLMSRTFNMKDAEYTDEVVIPVKVRVTVREGDTFSEQAGFQLVHKKFDDMIDRHTRSVLRRYVKELKKLSGMCDKAITEKSFRIPSKMSYKSFVNKFGEECIKCYGPSTTYEQVIRHFLTGQSIFDGRLFDLMSPIFWRKRGPGAWNPLRLMKLIDFEGIATCDHNDQFVPSIGRKVATAKAEDRYFEELTQLFVTVKSALDNEIKLLEKNLTKYQRPRKF